MDPRCPWARDEPEQSYHDTEWGVPRRDDAGLFEFLVLEGAQAGLSWRTILLKRENYRRAFAGFDAQRVARFTARDVERILGEPDGARAVVRHRGKVESAIANARAFLEVRESFGGFGAYAWGFVDGEPLVHRRRAMREVPARTPLSDALSKDLKRRGFSFVGSTICYAFMQAVGMVNDHLVTCPRWRAVQTP